MLKNLFIFSSMVLLCACGKDVERDIRSNPSTENTNREEPVEFSIKPPKESVSKSQAPEKRLECERIENPIELPSERDPCLIVPEELGLGIYSLSRIDLKVNQAETKETLLFSRELASAGVFKTEDKVRRDEWWGVSDELLIDLNLPMQMWKQAQTLSFEQKQRHQVTFDRAKDRVLSKTVEAPSTSGSKIYELLSRARGEESLPIGKMFSGNVAHDREVIFDAGTDHEVRVKLEAFLISGTAMMRRVGQNSDRLQIFLSYPLKGRNSLNYVITTAYEYRLIEKPVKFKAN